MLGVVSDTHGAEANIEKALATFRDYRVDHIIHCGDVEDPLTIRLFQEIPTDYVLGNKDREIAKELEEAIQATGGVLYGDVAEIEWCGKKIFVTHGDNKQALNDAIYSGEYQMVFSGHTHWYKEETTEDGTLVLNPGAVLRGEYHILGSDGRSIHFSAD